MKERERSAAQRLQDILAEARRVKGVSLREVERSTGISNAYLSQMESGSVAEPSPKKLKSLADYYGVSYVALMNACGYSTGSDRPAQAASALAFMGDRLTPAESAAVAAFLHELRKRSGK
jgi:HTH-type transcriptional regulator, competence development regulator